VGGYSLNFLATGAGLSFTMLTSTSTATPLFPAPLDGSSSLTATVHPGWRVNANDDVDSNIPEFNNAGLAKISYTIATGNLGTTYPMTFDAQGSALTAIATFDGTPYDVTLEGGSITVTAIPEPDAFALLALVAPSAAWLHKHFAGRSAMCS